MSWASLDSVRDWDSRIGDLASFLYRAHYHAAPVVLMYHGILARRPSAVGIRAVDKDGFARQIRYLKRHLRILHAAELEDGAPNSSKNRQQAVVITFDDGFANNAKIALPILEELRVPAIFFVTTRHLDQGRYLWFAHARALFHLWPAGTVELLGRKWHLRSPSSREGAVQAFMTETRNFTIDEVYRELSQYPVDEFAPPRVVEDELRGMTETELAAMAQSSLSVVGAHTCNHPYLTQCSVSEREHEIDGAKTQLEKICGRPVTSFAYPDGDYDNSVALQVKQAGYRLAFAVKPRTRAVDPKMAIPRVGIYRGGIGALAVKSCGLTA
jgi:peptidoglycan/xylan/chitin deacetylase (PgdA/CDA1 family)